MTQYQYLLALQLNDYREITLDRRTVHAVPGDVIVDSPDGKRVLMHKVEFERFVQENGYQTSGDQGQGWVTCRR